MRYFRFTRIQRKVELWLQRVFSKTQKIPAWCSAQGTPWWWSVTRVTQVDPYWEAGRTAWYTWLLPLTKELPYSLAGWWYLQWWYGAGYYQYRFTLIAMVDNYRVVDLHAVGYLRWRKWWRYRGYPRLVKRFPRWGNLTSAGVWWAHHLSGQTTSAGWTRWYHGWKRMVPTRWTIPTRATSLWALGFQPTVRPRRWPVPPVKTPWRPIQPVRIWNPTPRGWQPTLGGGRRRWVISGVGWSNPVGVSATPLTHPGWAPLPEETNLSDGEWLTLDGVFPYPEREPFQEEPMELFEDQQDDHYDDDEEPANPEDTLYGTGAAGHKYEDLDNILWISAYRVLRYVDPLDMPRVPPYQLRTGEVTSFHLRGRAEWDTLLGAGDGPTPEDDDRDELTYEEDSYTEVADWYTYATAQNRLTDDDPLTNEWTGWWRNRRRAQPYAVVTRPDRLYTVDRLHPRWWHLQFRHRHFRGWKRLIRSWQYNWLRRPHRRHRPEAGPTRGRPRVFRRRYRFTRWKGWHRRRWDWWWWTWRRWATRFPARYWRGWATRRVGTTRLAHSQVGWDFVQRHETHLEREGLILPSGWARWVLPRRHRLHTPAGHYPRYEPVGTGQADTIRVGLSPWGEPVWATPIGWWFLVGILLLDCIVGVALDFGNTPVGDPWTVSWYPAGGAPHWWEHYRLAPPRGWWNWPGNPGVDANLYVWGWWADYYIPYLDGTGEVTSPDYLPGSFGWRSFSDARHFRGRYKFYPSFPPWLPSYLSSDRRFWTLSSYGPGMWIPGEPETPARTVNTRYMRGSTLR